MARIKYASIVSSVSGSVGSATFQKSLYGDILRNKPRPRRSASVSQLARRALMMRVHGYWSALTSAQRTQWNQFIAFANATIRRDRAVLQSGHSYFLKYNYMRLLTGQAILSAPLYTLLAVDFPAFSLSWSDNENEWNLVINATAPGTALWFILKLSSKIPVGQSFKKSGLRYMPIVVVDDSSFAMRDIYYDIFGYYLQDNDWVSFEIQYFGITNTMISGRYTGTVQLK